MDAFRSNVPGRLRDPIRNLSEGLGQVVLVADHAQAKIQIAATRGRPGGWLGVEGQSRLISRIRPRQFGVLVTTSYVGEQGDRELGDDMHPVVILAGRDLVEILADHQLAPENAVKGWLRPRFDRKIETVGEAIG